MDAKSNNLSIRTHGFNLGLQFYQINLFNKFKKYQSNAYKKFTGNITWWRANHKVPRRRQLLLYADSPSKFIISLFTIACYCRNFKFLQIYLKYEQKQWTILTNKHYKEKTIYKYF